MNANDTNRTVAVLNRLLEAELAGVVRYTHYSFLVFGFGRIPIVSWLRGAGDRIARARAAGRRLDHDARRATRRWRSGRCSTRTRPTSAPCCASRCRPRAPPCALYRELLDVVAGNSVALEEFARQMIQAEELHAAEVDKMLQEARRARGVRRSRGHEILTPSAGERLVEPDARESIATFRRRQTGDIE